MLTARACLQVSGGLQWTRASGRGRGGSGRGVLARSQYVAGVATIQSRSISIPSSCSRPMRERMHSSAHNPHGPCISALRARCAAIVSRASCRLLSLSSFVPVGASFLHSKALLRPNVLSLRRAKSGGKQATKGSCANRAQLAHVKELAGAPPDPSTSATSCRTRTAGLRGERVWSLAWSSRVPFEKVNRVQADVVGAGESTRWQTSAGSWRRFCCAASSEAKCLHPGEVLVRGDQLRARMRGSHAVT